MVNDWLGKRLRAVLPRLMRETGIDLWLVSAREYNEDPVMWSLMPAPMLSARRRTILIFALIGDELEALHAGPPRTGLDDFYTAVWNRDQEDQWQCVARIVGERDPQSIGVDTGETFAFGDGLSHTEQGLVVAALQGYENRVVSAERLAVGWLERRLPEEITVADGINRFAQAVIAEAFSPAAIHPGVTTAADVSWWLRQRARDAGVDVWFQPSVSVQRRGVDMGDIGITRNVVIEPGDLLHCDFGIKYLGLCTDTQQLAYIPRPGEQCAPSGLTEALKAANRLQDIVTGQFAAGRSGNEVLKASLDRMKLEGLGGRIYCHPTGTHGHGAGAYIGMYDNQDWVPGRGDYPIVGDALYSIELFAQLPVPEWDGQVVKAALEQIVAFTAAGVNYLGGGRQTELHLV